MKYPLEIIIVCLILMILGLAVVCVGIESQGLENKRAIQKLEKQVEILKNERENI